MNIHLAVPNIHGGVLYVEPGPGPGVVDQDVQPAVSGYRSGHGVGPVLLAGHVQSDKHRVSARLSNLSGSFLASLLLDVSEDHFGPFLGKKPGRSPAKTHQLALDARGRSGDQRNFPL